MKLDIRPVKVLTRAILDTSPAWMILDHGLADMRPSIEITTECTDTTSVIECLEIRYERGQGITCYPCKAVAPFEPIPWPVVEGEVEIEEWRHYSAEDYSAHKLTGSQCWWLCREKLGIATIRLDVRLGYHPSPRRQIDADGTETPVWVWEADACKSI